MFDHAKIKANDTEIMSYEANKWYNITAYFDIAAKTYDVVVTDENGNDKIEIRLVLPITIAIDHRALDYGDVVPFMRKLDEIFDNPAIIQSWK